MRDETSRSQPPRGQPYLDIVWRQFAKNRQAYWSLVVLAILFLAAIFAPAIASNQPFVFWEAGRPIYPWLRALFNPEEVVDFVFNMALLAFAPWTVWALMTYWLGRRRASGRRALYLGLEYLLLTVAACFVFSGRPRPLEGIPTLRPTHQYWARTFPREEFAFPDRTSGIYPPIPFGPTEQDLDAIFEPPLSRKDRTLWRESNDGFVHLLGTDNTGRDVLTQILYGARISLTVGFMAVGIYVTIGILVGAVAGYFGGWVDILVSRIIEVVLLFPSFFLILTLVAFFGPSIYMIMFVIGITGWPTVARLIRGEVLKQRSMDYVTAARALGSSNWRMILRHILPNALSPAMVAAPFGVAGAIVSEAGLSLLGFGVRPPTPSWGTLLRLGSDNYTYWWLVLFPSLAIFLAVSVFNLVGSGLRDAMDPRLRI